jgi:hypothetical protein
MRIPEPARTQDGLFTRPQARQAGIARSTIARHLTAGQLIEVQPGVLCLADTPLTVDATIRAATLTCDAPASHWSAALVLGLDHHHPVLHTSRRHPSRSPLHVTAPVSSRRERAGITIHRTSVDATQLRVVRGIPVTDVQRTCIDLIAMLPREQGRSLAFRARQQGWLDAADLDQALQRRKGWHGTPRLVDVRPLFAGSAHSVAEWLLHEILRQIPGLVWRANATVRTSGGRRPVVDVLVEGVRLVLEVDGRAFHDGDRFVNDRRRQNDLVADGWTVLRFTWDDLVQQPERVRELIVATVHRLLAA